MMHRGGEKIRKETEGMTVEQLVEYWKQRSEEFRKKHEAIKKARSAG